MGTICVWEFLSIDGVMESPENWVNPYMSDDLSEYVKELNLATDALLLGRVTYEAFASFWPFQTHNEFGFAEKLNTIPKLVVSNTLETTAWNNASLIKGNAVSEISRLKQQFKGRISLTGSATLAQSLMKAGLIDAYQLIVLPVVLGEGIRFFSDSCIENLKLTEARRFQSGAALLAYQMG